MIKYCSLVTYSPIYIIVRSNTLFMRVRAAVAKISCLLCHVGLPLFSLHAEKGDPHRAGFCEITFIIKFVDMCC